MNYQSLVLFILLRGLATIKSIAQLAQFQKYKNQSRIKNEFFEKNKQQY